MSDAASDAGAPERRRLVVLGTVLLALALVGVANATVSPLRSGPGSGAGGLASAVYTDRSATSVAWYCPGPLPTGARPGDQALIAVSNLGRRVVHGDVTVSSTKAATRVDPLTVPAGSELVQPLSRFGTPSFSAATVLVDSASVGVEEVERTPAGVVSAPCEDRTSASEYVASGSTLGGNNLALAVFDPGATPSVVNVSFATGNGVVAPPSFQGIPIGAGGLVVLNVGHFLPSRTVVATTVSATGGRVIAGALETRVTPHQLFQSLVAAAANPSATWYFPAAPSAQGATVTYDLLNPGSRGALAAVRVAGAGSAEVDVEVPPHGEARVAPAATGAAGDLRYAVVSSSGAPIVAERSVEVPTASTAPVRKGGSKAAGPKKAPALASASPTVLPTLPAGYALTSGERELSRTWLLPGGRSDTHTSELVTVADPGPSAASVTLAPLGSSPLEIGASQTLDVPAGGAVVVDLARLAAVVGPVSLVVSADRPVSVGALLYSIGSIGSIVGLSAPAALPVF